MSVVVIILLLFLALKLWADFEKYVVIISAWILPLQMLVIGSYSLMSFLSVYIFIVALLHGYVGKNNYPFGIPALILMISILLSNIFGYFKHWGSCLTMISLDVLFPYILWRCITRKKMIIVFLRHIFIFLSLLVLYGFFEELIRDNPLVKFMTTNDSFSKAIGYTMEVRFGFKRLQSFLPLCGALGCCCTMNFLLVGYWQKYKNESILPIDKYVPYLLIGLLICTLFTGTRSVIAGFFIMLLFFVNAHTLKSKKIQAFIPFLFLAIIMSLGFLDSIIDSFSNTDSVNGSSSDMRQMQFDLALYFMGQSPLVGNGLSYTFEYVQAFFPDEILGAESVWFPLMIDQGLLGVVSYFIFLFIPFFYGIKNKNLAVVFCVLSFAVEKTLSSLPGINISYFMVYVILLIKIQLFFDLKKNERTVKRISQ